MFSVTKEIAFCAGHRLLNYAGACKNIHGHNYKALIELKEIPNPGKPALTDIGVLKDFNEMKRVKLWIDRNWDHALLIHSGDQSLIDFVKVEEMKYYVFAFCNATAEHMAMELFSIIKREFAEEFSSLQLKVTIYETPTSFAEYSA